ncbi:MAG: DUF6152 family protein [Gammaproteobacteria bacterium]
MSKRFALIAAVCALTALTAAAHHSFAIYDMTQNIEFEGLVGVVKLRNPHMAMTLVETKADGSKATINFVEGAPANMIVHLGLNPDDIAPGKKIKAIGAPRRDNPAEFFLKAVILPDGQKFSVIN